MKRRERLGEARAPDGTILRLYRHDGAFSIDIGGIELMSTRRYHSEEQLAQLACAPIQGRPAPRVLVGGLGLGFTLRAALRVLPPDATVVVAELVSAIIEWNQNPDYPLARPSLEDPRVDLQHDDVANVLRASPASFDAIMLDVDNGSEAMTTAGNAALYRKKGVRLALSALRTGGRLAYWSASDDPLFAALLTAEGLDVSEVRVRTHPRSRSKHTLLLASEPEP